MLATLFYMFRVMLMFLYRDERKALMTNERLSILDEAEIKSTIAEKTRFLELAMK